MGLCSICLASKLQHMILSSTHFWPHCSYNPLQTKPKKQPNHEILSSHSVTTSTKRVFNLSILAFMVTLHNDVPMHGFVTNMKANAEEKVKEKEEEYLELDRYTDTNEGFTLLIPHSWIKVDKPGATVLFQEPNNSANNLGVVVNPVRLSNLQEFGTPEFVADKLIQAEKRKESTKDAEVLSVSKRAGKGGLQVYEFEYKVDSSRGGLKRVFSAAFVVSKKLYILNISQSDKPESPLDLNRRTILQEIVHSFDSAEQ